MYVTRTLGLSGYNVGKGWGIKVSAGLDTSTLVTSNISSGTTTFSGGIFSGQTVIAQTGVTYSILPTYVKTGSNFNGTSVNYSVLSFTGAGATLSGSVSYTATTMTGTSYTKYEDMVIAIVRTRGSYNASDVLTYSTTALTLNASGATDTTYGAFVLTATGPNGSEVYNCTLDMTSTNYISKVLGSTPKDKTTLAFVEDSYPDLIKFLFDNGYAIGISANLVAIDDTLKVPHNVQYQTPETPWIVSELRGNKIEKLFKFISISDGNSANKEIKISFVNINPATGEFDVVVRDFNDTDDNINVFETFSRCTLNKSDNAFVGKKIGDGGVNYDNNSNYIFLEFDNIETLSQDAFPAGFEGYTLRSYGTGLVTGGITGQTANLEYKKSYSGTDKLNKTYLGISERAYDTIVAKGTGFNPDLFDFYGEYSASGSTKVNGFHLDSGATGTFVEGSYILGTFSTGIGSFQTDADVANPSSPYFDKRSRKFTVVPYGGFDGWDIYRDSRTTGDRYRLGGSSYSPTADFAAYTEAINTFSNASDVIINLFATPGIDWLNNQSLVDNTIEMIEEERGDALYIIDAPDKDDSITMSEEYSDDLGGTDIDSSFSCTYAPWIQIYDQNSASNIYVPATGEAAKNMALTDSTKGAWWSPAGTTRGLCNARRAKRKLKDSDADTLYAARINPVRMFPNIGVDIFGQKTLQIRDSALDRINVRRLLLYIRKAIAQISVNLLFEQNDDETIRQFLDKANTVLSTIKRERGLIDFKIEYQDINTPESMDRNELYFNLYLKPTPALEFIGITLIVTPSGVSFSAV